MIMIVRYYSVFRYGSSGLVFLVEQVDIPLERRVDALHEITALFLFIRNVSIHTALSMNSSLSSQPQSKKSTR